MHIFSYLLRKKDNRYFPLSNYIKCTLTFLVSFGFYSLIAIIFTFSGLLVIASRLSFTTYPLNSGAENFEICCRWIIMEVAEWWSSYHRPLLSSPWSFRRWQERGVWGPAKVCMGGGWQVCPEGSSTTGWLVSVSLTPSLPIIGACV